MQQAAHADTRFFESVMNAFPSPVFVVDHHMEIVAKNSAAAQFFEGPAGNLARMATGELMHCVNSTPTHVECGHAVECRGCILREAVQAAIKGKRVTRRRCRMRLTREEKIKDVLWLITTSPFQDADRSLVLLILEDMSDLAELKAMIPICAGCKKVRDDREYWHHVEAYLEDHLDLQFTHGLCPDCMTRLYPQTEHTDA